MLEKKEEYIKNKAFDDQYYKDLIISYLREYGVAQKKDVMKLLIPKLSDVLDGKQKEYKIQNLLKALKRDEIITLNSENKRIASWVLIKSN